MVDEVPKSYINCLEDMSIGQLETGWHPRQSTRLGVFRLLQCHGSHELIFSNPSLLAQMIFQAGRD
jgi:hypothetical protein